MNKYKEFFRIIDDLLKDEKVNQMKKYRQHCDITTYEHCKNVAYMSYRICKKLNLDYVSAARAGMLHDLFLYDWREKREINKFTDKHAFKHPKIALDNAKTITALTAKEEDIILKHMWPVTLMLPKYKESYVVTLIDKYSAVLETLDYIKRKNSKRILNLMSKMYILIKKRNYET